MSGPFAVKMFAMYLFSQTAKRTEKGIWRRISAFRLLSESDLLQIQAFKALQLQPIESRGPQSLRNVRPQLQQWP